MKPAANQPTTTTTPPPQNKPAPAPTPAPTKPAPAPATTKPVAAVIPDATPAKNRLRTDVPESFSSEADWLAAKVNSLGSQGFRFKMDRSRAGVKCLFIPISKKGGLINPGLLFSDCTFVVKEITVMNILTGKPFLTIKVNANKGWDVINNENNNTLGGSIKSTQTNEIHKLSFMNNNAETASISFKCPVQSTGCCSSAKPANLYNIGFAGSVKGVELEENPNGNVCKEDFELNVYQKPDHTTQEFIALVALLQIAALDLK